MTEAGMYGDLVADQALCGECHGPALTWFAPNALWNLVMGGPKAKDDPGGMLCPNCFIRKAEAAGIKPTAWVLDAERAKAGLAELLARLNGPVDWAHFVSDDHAADHQAERREAASAIKTLLRERDEAQAVKDGGSSPWAGS